MAIIAGAQSGKVPYQANGATDSRAPVYLGTPTNVTNLTVAQTLALPVDPSGNTYKGYLLFSAGPIWYAFTNGSGAATAAGTNCFLLNNGSGTLVCAPTGATSISVVFDSTTGLTSATVGAFSIIGIY